MSHATDRRTESSGLAPPLIGRTAERVLLAEQLSAMREGHGNVVIIGGEAGIGKTTLARDLVAHARAEGCAVVVGHCHDLMAAAPYGLWLDLADRYRHAPPHPDGPPLPAELASRVLDAIGSQAALFGHAADFLRALAERQPTVVVLEDVHWADPASLELLRHVAARVHQSPLLMLVTYREDELTRQNPFYQQLPALVHESGGLRLHLHPLGETELDALVRQGYPMPDPDRARLVRYLATHAEGNPFFALELLRALEELPEGGITRRDGAWRVGDLDRAVVPSLIRQVIDARVTRLGTEARDPLTVAAVIGHEIDPDLLTTLTGTPQAAIYAIIDTAIEGRLLAPTPDGAGLQFAHALTRESLYASIPPHRRRLLHARVAETLEQRPQPDPDAVAYHYQQAGDDRAPEWLIRAGERAQRAYAWLTARDRFEAAAAMLEAIPGQEGTRARLLYRCGRLLRYVDATTAIGHLREASRLAAIAGDEVLTADAIYSRGLVQCFADQWETGVADMARGVELLEALPPRLAHVPAETAIWMADALPTTAIPTADRPSGSTLTAIGPARHRSLTWFFAAIGRLAEARALAEHFDDGLPDTGIGPMALANMGHAELGRGIALGALGHPDDASAAIARARERYQRIDHHAVLAFAHLMELMDVVLPCRTDDVTARQQLAGEGMLEIERAQGAIPADTDPRLAELPVMLLDGRWDDALRIATAARSHGTYVFRRPVTLAVAYIGAARGDAAAVRAQVTALLPQGPAAAPGTAVLPDALMLQRLAAELALASGDREAARRWLEANDRWLAWSGSVLGRAENATGWAQLHRASGDTSAALQAADRAITLGSEPRQPLALIAAHRLRGDLHRESGTRDAAQDDLDASLALATRCALPFEIARTSAALARLLLDTDRAEAARLATEALDTARALGATPLVAELDALLTAASAPPGSAGDAPAGLTARELDVLALVAQGLTDAEIGDRLFISPRTVGQHLRSIYSKLEVRSRTEATRFALTHGLA